MSRKIYALFILLGAIGSLAGVYLYFFVYYTSTVTINANIENYTVSFFSLSTAQKREQTCENTECTILSVSPFQYNITVSAPGYETYNFSEKIPARTSVTLSAILQKKANLEVVREEVIAETPKQKIERLREEGRYYARFDIGDGNRVVFLEQSDLLEISYIGSRGTQKITSIQKIPLENIKVGVISPSEGFYIETAEEKLMFTHKNNKLSRLDFGIDIQYIKTTQYSGVYHIVSNKGSFYYDTVSHTSEFQYLFQDFVRDGDNYIGIIFSEEQQKKKNYNLTVSGDLIIYYNLKDKTRRVLTSPKFRPEKIEKVGDRVVISSGNQEYILENYK